MVESYLLLDGIGYVWIIRVFLLLMFVTPLLSKISTLIKKDWIFFLILILILTFNKLLESLSPFLNNFLCVKFILDEYVVYLLGYSTVFLLGLRLKYSDRIARRKSLLCYFIIFSLLFLSHLFSNTSLEINNYKYPPQPYYIVYGLFVCSLLWILQKWISTISCKLCKFIGQNTIWIYLWHIPIVTLCNALMDNWIIKYVVCFTLSFIIFRIQFYLVNKYLSKNNISKYLEG